MKKTHEKSRIYTVAGTAKLKNHEKVVLQIEATGQRNGDGFIYLVESVAAEDYDRTTAEGRAAAAEKELEEYKGMDIEGLRKSAADWQAKAEQAEKDADARVAAFQFDAKLDHAITAARGRNGKAIRALLDLDALRTSKDPDKDIAAALTAVQKDNGYMFDTAPTPPPLATGTGSTTMIGGKDADTAMRKAMGLPTK